jgi:uncharacterized protein (DUF2267 family)
VSDLPIGSPSVSSYLIFENTSRGVVFRYSLEVTRRSRTAVALRRLPHTQPVEAMMSATGLDVFDKTIHTTNIWLDELMADIGPDRQVAWKVLSIVLRTLRDRIPVGLAAHLGAQLPLIVRGSYYDQWTPEQKLLELDNQEQFFAHVGKWLSDIRPVNPRIATVAVFNVLSRHVPRGQCEKVREALPQDVQALWDLDGSLDDPNEPKAALGKRAENSADARRFEARPDGQRKSA